MGTIRGQRGNPRRVVGTPTAGRPPAAPASAASMGVATSAVSVASRTLAASVVLVAAVVLAGCDPRTDPGTPTTTAPASDGPSARPAVAVAPDLDGATAANAVNDAGDMVISRAGPAGMEFYYLAPGTRPVPLTHEGAPIEPRLLNNAGQVVGLVTDPAGHEPPRLVRWQDGHSTVLPVHGDEVIPEDLNDRGQVTAIAITRRSDAPGSDPATTARAYLTDETTAVDLGVAPDTNEHNLYLNEAGQVAGRAFVESGGTAHGFLWDDGELTTFDTGATTHPVITGINDAGQVVGLVLDDQDLPSGAQPIFRPAFRWTSGDLTMLDTRGAGAGPVRINRSGQVAGVVADPSGATRDVTLWSAEPDATPTRLGIPSPDYVVGINDGGDVLVAGTVGPTASPGGYLWHDGRLVTLGTLGGLAADPKGLSAGGLVVGQSTSADNIWRAASWPAP
ncbi:hypothetical protein I6A84_28300 [Frankia sp. CNm7]|uniref:Uncharacterized protein n=2 Tax=Frankia nepalensis TaxID=1836974 RepID=A0A937UP56_9ACTN|nr:hypothetical protein [Frankia nepalensis]MBL7495037.1 hypothetical protein [Frankia nepalensis]MBL7511109.1 hypothetical protein [Frankia nepalensis]MBL7521876.1 hypothetical protein [Frankia nepalensis]MBL7626925.1 hypothetical protein [Frankia nepalensis]